MDDPATPSAGESRPDTFVIDEWRTMMRFVGFSDDEILRVKNLADFIAQQPRAVSQERPQRCDNCGHTMDWRCGPDGRPKADTETAPAE